jgi:hypothetical protein
MPLHVLAGPRDLLCPEPLPLDMLAALIGPRVRPATAFWLLPEHGYHDFLLEDAGDRRVEVFAHALAENFGTRFEPLVVLPGLLSADIDAEAVHDALRARAVLGALWHHRPAAQMVLHAFALPEDVDDGDGWAAAQAVLAPRLEARLATLRDGFSDAAGLESVSVSVTEPEPGSPAFAGLLRNAVAALVATRAGARLADAGLAPYDRRLRPALARLLADWHRAGLEPARPLGTAALDRIAERLTETLLVRGVADG